VPLPAPETKVSRLVGTGEKHIARLIEERALSTGEVAGALMSLELNEFVGNFPEKYFPGPDEVFGMYIKERTYNPMRFTARPTVPDRVSGPLLRFVPRWKRTG
jgi:hypothetical protein